MQGTGTFGLQKGRKFLLARFELRYHNRFEFDDNRRIIGIRPVNSQSNDWRGIGILFDMPLPLEQQDMFGRLDADEIMDEAWDAQFVHDLELAEEREREREEDYREWRRERNRRRGQDDRYHPY